MEKINNHQANTMAIETLFKYKGTGKGDIAFLREKLQHFSYFYTPNIDQYTIIIEGKSIWGHYFTEENSENNYFDVKYESAFQSDSPTKALFIAKMQELGFEVEWNCS